MDPVGGVTHIGKTGAAWYWPHHQGTAARTCRLAVFIYELKFWNLLKAREKQILWQTSTYTGRVDTSHVVVVMLVQYVDIYTGCTTRVHTLDVSRV